MFAHRWVFGRGRGGLSAENASAELASVRTRHQESEAERARLRAKVMELTQQLDETRRELRSAKAEAHIATLKDGGVPSVTPVENPEPVQPAAPETLAAPAAASAFLASADQGDPDDLKRIKGIGPKLEQTLNELGVFYYRQIAAWTDEQVAEVDEPLKFPGRILRDDWRGQAKTLAES